MNDVEVSVAFRWNRLGPVALDSDRKLVFPKPGNQPGLYRFEIVSSDGRSQYIGETDRLSRRLQHYRTPGASQPTNRRLNALLVEHLLRGDQVLLDTVTEDIAVSCRGKGHSVDLTMKSERLLFEAAALLNARAAGVPTLNL